MPLLDILLRPKNSQETITKLIAALQQLDNASGAGDAKGVEKASELVARYAGFLKLYLFGDEEREVTKEAALDLTRELMNTDLLYLLVKHLAQLDFEARKDASQILGATLRLRDDHSSPGAAYVFQHPYIISKLFQGCAHSAGTRHAAVIDAPMAASPQQELSSA